jgi:acyl-CoA synthetase (AMP-forming)/AMP-acid ligase II
MNSVLLGLGAPPGYRLQANSEDHYVYPGSQSAGDKLRGEPLFLGNTPDHPVNFFGALKAGARIVHLSPLDGARINCVLAVEHCLD